MSDVKLTDQRVRELRRRGYVRFGPDACDMLDALCDHWLASRPQPEEAATGGVTAMKLLREIDEYLSGHPQNAVWSRSKLHRDVRRALSAEAK